MELKAKFDIIYMREAIDFLEAMPEKARDKMAFNISKSRYFIDIELFKKTQRQYMGIPHKVPEDHIPVTRFLGQRNRQSGSRHKWLH